MRPLVLALSDGGAVSPSAISWGDCQVHFPEPTCHASAHRAEGLSAVASLLARRPRREARCLISRASFRVASPRAQGYYNPVHGT
jgi:hypothetical protein